MLNVNELSNTCHQQAAAETEWRVVEARWAHNPEVRGSKPRSVDGIFPRYSKKNALTLTNYRILVARRKDEEVVQWKRWAHNLRSGGSKPR
ncbi:hypothetical protein AVEN_164106-1 [Araneus ventricosus]|uniref:Uncharacterized protein n=1 Tax=Araneus ventricosus TaxID=182803 RepID=A0A4Y2NP32_ARAVE|nr:hypothetical protein AVEN_164106-1 [Araneus ventricosus]